MKTLKEHIEMYVESAINHGKATMMGDYKIANKNYYRIMKALNNILKYGSEGREEILKLLINEDDSVKCWAATHSLKYNELKALITLNDLSKGKGLICSDAKIVIEEWKKGNLRDLP